MLHNQIRMHRYVVHPPTDDGNHHADMDALRALVPVITRAEYDALPKEGTTREVLRTNSLKHCFAHPSVAAVRAAVDAAVLARGVEQRTLVDFAPGVDGKSNYLYDADTLEVGSTDLIASHSLNLFHTNANTNTRLRIHGTHCDCAQ